MQIVLYDEESSSYFFFLPSKYLKNIFEFGNILGFRFMLGFFLFHMMTIPCFLFFMKWLGWISSSSINFKKKIKTCVQAVV